MLHFECAHNTKSPTRINLVPGGSGMGILTESLGGRLRPAFWNPYPNWTKSEIFPTLRTYNLNKSSIPYLYPVADLHNNSSPCSNRCHRHREGLLLVVSTKKNLPRFKTRVQTHTLFMPKSIAHYGWKLYPLDSHMLSRAHIVCIDHIR